MKPRPLLSETEQLLVDCLTLMARSQLQNRALTSQEVSPLRSKIYAVPTINDLMMWELEKVSLKIARNSLFGVWPPSP